VQVRLGCGLFSCRGKVLEPILCPGSTENNYDWLKLWTEDPERTESSKVEESQIKGPGDEGKWTGRSRENWQDFVVDGDRMYYHWHSDGSSEDWGWKMRVTATFPDLGANERLRHDLVNAGGVQPLLVFATFADQENRQKAGKALANLSVSEGARKEIDRQNGMDPLLRLLTTHRYRTTEGLTVSARDSPDSGKRGTIPPNTAITVDLKVWYYRDEQDPTHLHPDGYYRGRVVDPKEHEGWVSLQEPGVQQLGLDDDTVRLLSLLSLEPNNRDKLITIGKLRIILQLANTQDKICRRVAALALDDIAGLPERWQRAASCFELSLQVPIVNSDPKFHNSMTLELLPASTGLPVSFPVFAGKPLPGMRVMRGPAWSAGNQDGYERNLGTIVGVSMDDVSVRWDGAPESEVYEYEFSAAKKQVLIIQDQEGNIISFPTKAAYVMYESTSNIGNGSSQLRITDRPNSQKALEEYRGGPAPAALREVVNPFYLHFTTNADEAASNAFRLKLFVAAKYQDDPPMMSYHESAYQELVAMLDSPDVITRRAACSALGKLGVPVKTESDGYKRRSYRDRIVRGRGLLGLLAASKSSIPEVSQAASTALNKMIPDMKEFLIILPRIMDSAANHSALSSFAAFTFFR
jgi:hypothetical protein